LHRFLIFFALLGVLSGINTRLFFNYFAPKPHSRPLPVISATEKVQPQHQTINLLATGDILMHNTVIASGLTMENTYQYEHLFAPIKHIVEQADYASIALEAAMAGPQSGFTGYPLFNTPDATAWALKNSGFDLVVTAHNHCLDRGLKGALRTLEVLKEAGLDTIGTYASSEEKKQFLIKDIQGVKVAYLAYTYGTNGIPIPEQAPYLVNFINEENISRDIQALRPHVDIIVLILHWGIEYQHYPTAEQQQMVFNFLKAGADVILGSHPHVVQPAQIINLNGAKKFVIYSMGNSIGHQRGTERNSGVIINLQFTKDFSTNKTVLEEVKYIPTFSHPYYKDGKQYFRVIPIDETITAIRKGEEPYLKEKDIPQLIKIKEDTLKYLQAMNSL